MEKYRLIHMTEKNLLIEKIQLKKTPELSSLCHECKNLYNLGNYYVSNWYFINEEYLHWYDTNWMLKKTEPFKKLPSQVAQNVLKYLHFAWKSYFASLKDYRKNPHKYKGIPRPPRYLKKESEFFACFNKQTKIYNHMIHFPKKTRLPRIYTNTTQEELQQIRIVPKYDIYNLEVIYNHKEQINLNLDKSKVLSLKLAVNNLATAATNIPELRPFVINGRPLKSINQYYNKTVARLQREKTLSMVKLCEKQFSGKTRKKNGKYTKEFVKYVEAKSYSLLQQTRRMKKLRRVRGNKIFDYMHKATRYIINYCVEQNIGNIVIGKSKNGKQKVNIGRVNNQNIMYIPFELFVNLIEYKANLGGIEVSIVPEALASQTCFHCGNNQKANRKNGLYICDQCGIKINVYLNSAYNLIERVFPLSLPASEKKYFFHHPSRITLK